MEKLDPKTDGATPDIMRQNIEQLKTLFPDLLSEGEDGAAINADVLKALVGDQTVTDCDEKYGLNWHGKRAARQLALTPSTGTLRPCLEDSVDWETTQNLMIEGDNLEVLKLLQKSYAGQVKLIYIDPPYNTGSDFVYPDDFRDGIRNYLELTGQVVGGAKMTSNMEASGRLHTDWLNMIYPRLRLARDLLCQSGAIAISIDDHELQNLKHVCDEVFGPENLIGCITRATGTTTGQDAATVGSSLDYLVMYSRGSEFRLRGVPLSESDKARFNREDEHGKYSILQLRKTGSADRREDRPSMYYAVEAPDGTEVWPVGPGGYESRWRFGPDTYRTSQEKGLIEWVQRDSEGYTPYVKYYLEGRTKQVSNLWMDLDGNKRGTIELRELLGRNVFDNPKPTALLRRIIQIASNDDSLILDFFAGSGTAGHAAMAENASDGGTRRYVLVQLPEPLAPEDKDQKTAADYCGKLGRPRNIAEITKERLRCAANKIKLENPLFAGDLGFRVFKLDSTNIQEWAPDRDRLAETLVESVEHLRVDRSEADILYELLLKLGLDLCVPIEEKMLAGKTVHSVGAGALFVCLAGQISQEDVEELSQGIVDWLAELAPSSESTVVFRDSAFADDVAKSNLAAILEQHGIENVRSL